MSVKPPMMRVAIESLLMLRWVEFIMSLSVLITILTDKDNANFTNIVKCIYELRKIYSFESSLKQARTAFNAFASLFF